MIYVDSSEFAGLFEELSKLIVIIVSSAIPDNGLIMEEEQQKWLVNEVLNRKHTTHSSQPPPVGIDSLNGNLLHSVDCEWPANEENYKSHAVEPMVVSIDLLLADINLLLERFHLLFVRSVLYLFLILILLQKFVVDLSMEKVAPQEGENDRCSPSNHS